MSQPSTQVSSGLVPQQHVYESVARYFSVLGEPTRLRILHTVCQEEKCVNDIIAATGLAQANVSRHLGLMYQAGMLTRRREGNQIFYRVVDDMAFELCRSVTVQVVSRLQTSQRAQEVLEAQDIWAQERQSPLQSVN